MLSITTSHGSKIINNKLFSEKKLSITDFFREYLSKAITKKDNLSMALFRKRKVIDIKFPKRKVIDNNFFAY